MENHSIEDDELISVPNPKLEKFGNWVIDLCECCEIHVPEDGSLEFYLDGFHHPETAIGKTLVEITVQLGALLRSNPELALPLCPIFWPNLSSENKTEPANFPSRIQTISSVPSFLTSSSFSFLDSQLDNDDKKPKQDLFSFRKLIRICEKITNALTPENLNSREAQQNPNQSEKGTGTKPEILQILSSEFAKSSEESTSIGEFIKDLNTRLIESGFENEQMEPRIKLRVLGEGLQTFRTTKLLCGGLVQRLHQAISASQQKLQITKDLVYGASHEVNNPLANIASRAQRLLSIEDSPEKRKLASVINAQAFRGFDMLANMMFFASPPKPSFKLQSLKETFLKAVSETQKNIGKLDSQFQVDVELAEENERYEMKFDPQQIEALISSLLKNSFEAIPKDSNEKRVTASLVRIEKSQLLSQPFFMEEDEVDDSQYWNLIVVSDQGDGLGELTVDRIFHPFFSGREAGRGLGFGLAKVYRITQAHRGHIFWMNHNEISSETNGCTVVIALPETNTEPVSD